MELAASHGSVALETSVLVIDDHRAFAQALGLAVDLQPDMQYLGTATTAKEALRRLAETCATVVIVDIGLPEIDGIELLPQIRRLRPESRILLITGSDDPELLAHAGRSGAERVLRKVDPLSTIIAAIRQSEAAATGALTSEVGKSRLTDRELEVLDLLSDGHSVTTIARRLNITVNTCRGYVRTILVKLDAHSQLAAVANAGRLGVLPPRRSRPE